MPLRFRLSFVCSLLVLAPAIALGHSALSVQDEHSAQVEPGLLALATRFQSHMVLQRGAPLRIEGTAAPSASVTVTFDGELAVTPADEAGRWSTTFAAREGSVLPRNLVVQAGQERVVVEDVLVGDVWLFAGAAELAAPLQFTTEGQASPSLPGHVRFWLGAPAAPLGDVVWTPEQRRAVAEQYLAGRWCRGDALDGPSVSAIASHFARALESEQRVPLGIVQLATKPLPLESWLPRSALLSDPRLASRLVGWWRSKSVGAGLRARAQRHFAGHFDRADHAPDERVHPFQPGFLWAAELGRLRGVPTAGVVFGCSTDFPDEPELHEHLLRTLIGSWREHFVGPLPFVLVESSGHDLFLDPDGLAAALRRDAERRIASVAEGLPDVGQVVTADLGGSERSRAERPEVIGQRLAAWALDLVHGRDGIVASGPLPGSCVKEAKRPLARVSFFHGDGLRTSDGGPPSGLSAVASDGRPVSVRPEIVGGELWLEFPDGAAPTEVRYGFGSAGHGNLVNRAGLPAPTFRLELAQSRPVEAAAARGK